MKIILAGDIGGTKTSLGLFSKRRGACRPLHQETYASNAYPNLEAVVSAFLNKIGQTAEGAVFAVAGPVIGGRARLTNLPWTLDETVLAETLGIEPVRLVNDLAAMMESTSLLSKDDLVSLNPASAVDETGNRAIIAPGTGLGEAFAVWDGRGYLPQPSEGGHCDFAPRNDLEIDLLWHLRKKSGHVSYESICSGPGLQNIYRFLRDTGKSIEPPYLAELLSSVPDPTPLIVRDATERRFASHICTRCLKIFVSVLGAEAGNLALKSMATGGIYVGGGIPRRILPFFQGDVFLQAFTDKGRFSDLLSHIPVHIITHPDAALIGAAQYGLRTMGTRSKRSVAVPRTLTPSRSSRRKLL